MMNWLRSVLAFHNAHRSEREQFSADLEDLERRQIATDSDAARLEARVARYEQLRREQRRLIGD